MHAFAGILEVFLVTAFPHLLFYIRQCWFADVISMRCFKLLSKQMKELNINTVNQKESLEFSKEQKHIPKKQGKPDPVRFNN